MKNFTKKICILLTLSAINTSIFANDEEIFDVLEPQITESCQEVTHEDLLKIKNELIEEISIERKNIAELNQSMQSLIQKINSFANDNAEFTKKMSDFEKQLEIKSQSIIIEVNNKLAEFSEKESKILKDIMHSINSQPTIDTNEPLITQTQGVMKNGRHGIMYTVKSGDSISKIAEKTQCSQKDIQEFNNLKNTKSIRIGQELFIPQN